MASCPKCFLENDEKSKYCLICGTKIITMELPEDLFKEFPPNAPINNHQQMIDEILGFPERYNKFLQICPLLETTIPTDISKYVEVDKRNNITNVETFGVAMTVWVNTIKNLQDMTDEPSNQEYLKKMYFNLVRIETMVFFDSIEKMISQLKRRTKIVPDLHSQLVDVENDFLQIKENDYKWALKLEHDLIPILTSLNKIHGKSGSYIFYLGLITLIPIGTFIIGIFIS